MKKTQKEQPKQFKAKRITIYLTFLGYEKLKEIQNRYHVSISTISDVLIANSNHEIIKKLSINYIYKNERKTSIKPRIHEYLKDFADYKESDISKIATNILELYARNELLPYYNNDNDALNKYKTKIGNELNVKREIFWNYNAVIRENARAIRENTDYYRRLLDNATQDK